MAMNKPIQSALAALAIAAAAKAASSGEAARGLELRLEMPWTILAAGESPAYSLVLLNAGWQPAVVFLPDAKQGLERLTGGQAYLMGEFEQARPEVWGFPWLRPENASWPPVNPEGKPMQGISTLPPGHRIKWQEGNVQAQYYGIEVGVRLRNLSAAWHAGPARWVYAAPVPLQVIKVPSAQRDLIYSNHWTWAGRQSRSVTVASLPLEGRRFLFAGSGEATQDCNKRLCEIFPGEEFGFELDESFPQLVLRFEDVDRGAIFFHLNQGIVSPCSWAAANPPSFAPKPEPIPPDELLALRAAAGLDAEGRPRAMAAGEGAKRLPARAVAALIAVLASLAGGAILMQRWKRSRSSK
jgi:hypothetical protein